MEEIWEVGWRLAVSWFIVRALVVGWSKLFPDDEPRRHRLCWIGVLALGTCIFLVGWGASWPGPTYMTLALMLIGCVLVARAYCDLVRSFAETPR